MKGTAIELNGERHVLRYTINALAELERHMGRGLDHIFSEEAIGYNLVRGMLWAGMLHENPMITPRAIGEALEQHVEAGGELLSLFNACIEAIQDSSAGKAFGIEEADAGPFEETEAKTG